MLRKSAASSRNGEPMGERPNEALNLPIYRPGEIAIFARTGQLLRDRARAAAANAGLQAHELADHAEAGPGHIAIGTMHRSKGLQYRAVAIIGVEVGELPLERVVDRQADEAARAAFLELERNLLYVACTRARERLLVTGVRELSGFLGAGAGGLTW